MKNFVFKPLLILFLIATTFSCSSDDDPAPIVYPQEKPLAGFLGASEFTTQTEAVNIGYAEFGYKFRPSVTGAITALTVKIPDVNSALRVTIWDVESETPIKTELFNVTSSGVAVTKTITALGLTKDKEYMISMNSNDWYTHKKADNSNVTYPITVGSIQVTGFGYINGTAQSLPTTFVNDYFAGDVTFTFQRVL
jgi:hypothetical protein